MHEHEENKSKLATTKQGKATVISVWCRWMADYCYLLYTNDHFQHDPVDWNKLHSLSSWINLTWAASVCCQHSQYWYLGDYIHGWDSLVWLSQLLNCKYRSLINKGSEEDTIIGCIAGVLCWLADFVKLSVWFNGFWKLSAGLQSTVPAWTTLTVWSAVTTRVMLPWLADFVKCSVWFSGFWKLSAGLLSTVPAWTTLTVWSAVTTRVMPLWLADFVKCSVWFSGFWKFSAGFQSTIPAWTTLTVWSAMTTRVMPPWFADFVKCSVWFSGFWKLSAGLLSTVPAWTTLTVWSVVTTKVMPPSCLNDTCWHVEDCPLQWVPLRRLVCMCQELILMLIHLYPWKRKKEKAEQTETTQNWFS